MSMTIRAGPLNLDTLGESWNDVPIKQINKKYTRINKMN